MTESQEKPRKYSLRLKEIPICIVDKDGAEKAYKMQGLTGKQRAQYLNDINEHVQIIDEKVTVDNFEGLQESLLCKCLKDERGALVSFDTLQEYPSTVLEELFDEAQKLSGLDKGAKAAAKND